MDLGWILDGSWMDLGWILDGSWMDLGWISDGLGWILDGLIALASEAKRNEPASPIIYYTSNLHNRARSAGRSFSPRSPLSYITHHILHFTYYILLLRIARLVVPFRLARHYQYHKIYQEYNID